MIPVILAAKSNSVNFTRTEYKYENSLVSREDGTCASWFSHTFRMRLQFHAATSLQQFRSPDRCTSHLVQLYFTALIKNLNFSYRCSKAERWKVQLVDKRPLSIQIRINRIETRNQISYMLVLAHITVQHEKYECTMWSAQICLLLFLFSNIYSNFF